jgi:hypothetical protein
MPLLTDQEFQATFAPSMQRIAAEDPPPFDFWPYFEAIPRADFEGYDCSRGIVDWAWRTPTGSLVHVLVTSNDPNVFMVLVLDVAHHQVIGHHVLNLAKEYGLDPPTD